MVHFETEELIDSLLKICRAVVARERKGQGAVTRETPTGLNRARRTLKRLGRGVPIVLLAVIVLSGCERKQVYIPPEYSISSPAHSSDSAPETTAPPVRQVPPDMPRAPEMRSQETHASPAPVIGPVHERFELQPTAATEKKQKPDKLNSQEAAKSPQRQASMQQVSLARGQLERGKPDAAIRTLEKAVRIDAGNGDAFILLARAWKQKGEKRKALEFAKKAELLCHKQPAKLKEVYLLESDLYRELGVKKGN